ncbi:MAG: methyltransferase [Waddliaceae bacterium]
MPTKEIESASISKKGKQKIWELMRHRVVDRAIYVVADLGIPDILLHTPLDSRQLAEKIDVHEASLYRLMRMLVSYDFFDEDEEGKYSVTPLGHCLCSGQPDSLRNMILQEDEIRWRALGNLKSSVVTGKPAFDLIYGKNYFEYLSSHPLMSEKFDAGMANITEEEDRIIAKAINFGESKTIVDVGGGTGHFLAQILSNNETLKGILFELPQVVFSSTTLHLGPFADRFQTSSGTFFETAPEGGDVYLLKRVLHDWDDHACIRILSNIRKAIQVGKKLFIFEFIIREGKAGQQEKTIDVAMMALFPGRERTEQEFSTLLETSGFSLKRIMTTKCQLCVIEAVAV